MQLTDIIELNNIKVPLKAMEKHQAITELIDLLFEWELISDYDAIHEAVMKREAVRSTGVGQGFAVPHCKSNVVDRMVMALGKTVKPIDFESIDSKPVSMIVLLLSPADQTGPHIQALANISRLMTAPEYRQELWNCMSAEELYKKILQYEQENQI